jgi:hypothetical protein
MAAARPARDQLRPDATARGRRRLSTRRLGAGFASVLGVAAGTTAAADPGVARLPGPYTYYNNCATPGVNHHGVYVYDSNSNSGRALQVCTGGGSGYACITQSGSQKGIIRHNGWFYCVNNPGYVAWSNCIDCGGNSNFADVVRLSAGRDHVSHRMWGKSYNYH